jgi:hypothetical protein
MLALVLPVDVRHFVVGGFVSIIAADATLGSV